MNVTQLARWAPIGGITFVVLLIVGLVLLTDIPSADASDQEITDYLTDSDVHIRNIIGLYLWAFAGAAFLWFLAHLRGVLREAEGQPGTLSTLAFGAGVLFVAALFVSAVAIGSIAGAIEFGSATEPAPDFVRMLPQMGFGILLIGGGFAAIVMLISASLVILQTGVLPQWLAWLGFVAAFALLFAAVFLPMIALPIWVLAVSIVMLMQREETAPVAT
jgi:hypothetical protein